MRRLLIILLLAMPAITSAASDTDGQGYLTQLLETNLSTAGQSVKITGFQGALSSRATLKTLTIADTKGIWLTLKGVTLDWSRSALLSGRVDVNQLTADEISVTRRPEAAAPTTPAAEASGFSLPELPVSVSIGKIEAKKVVLGAPVLGQAATLKVTGSASLAAGEGSAKISVARTDGKLGEIALAAGYNNSTKLLSLTVKANEAAGGIISTLAGIPNAPAIALDISGTGPTNDFAADIKLATAGKERLRGKVTIKGQTDLEGTTSRFMAQLGGDIAPLFAPDYRDFFGSNIQVNLDGARTATGELELSRLELTAQQIAVSGRVTISSDGMPGRIDLTGEIASKDAAPVVLPLPGERTTLAGASFKVSFDASSGDEWRLQGDVRDLRRPDMALASAKLGGAGKIGKLSDGDANRGIQGALDLEASGLSMRDAALAEALGSQVALSGEFSYHPGAPLEVSSLKLLGADYSLSGEGQISGLTDTLLVAGKAQATAQNVGRLSGLAGRKLSGQLRAEIEGSAQVLAGIFDFNAAIDGQSLSAGEPQLDALLSGASHIDVSIKRDTEGTLIRSLQVNAQSLTAKARGTLQTGSIALNADLSFKDVGQLGKGFGGALEATGSYLLTDAVEKISAKGTGQDLMLAQDLSAKLLAGKTSFAVAVQRSGKDIGLDSLEFENPQISALVAPSADGQSHDVKARLSDIALLAAGISGPVTAEGQVVPGPQGYSLSLSARGPGGTDAKVQGQIASDLTTANLSAAGSTRAELANAFIAPRSVAGPVRFDLALNGPISLASLSGQVSLTEGRIAAPVLGLSATGASLDAQLGGGRVMLAGQLTSGGGTVKLAGPISMSAPYPSDIGVTLARVALKNPELYSTSVSGNLSIKGPLTDGAQVAGLLALGRTEIRVPSTGLGGLTAIPEGLQHQGAPAPVQATLERAGVGDDTASSAASGRPIGLNIKVAAPSQVFVRGRGLDAELGGQIQLTGTSANVIPIGEFNLIRGRLDILGKRFNLTEGKLSLQGSFVPYVILVASTSSGEVTASVNIEGEATDPTITFTSSPPLPQDEVLAQLMFGHGLSRVSPFQAAQLASAVAALAGKGGDGIVSKLRQGFGLDDLNVNTDATGQTSVTLGKKISERVYSDVTIGQDGTSEIGLNLDVTKSITLKGKTSIDGKTGIGIFFEKDY